MESAGIFPAMAYQLRTGPAHADQHTLVNRVSVETSLETGRLEADETKRLPAYLAAYRLLRTRSPTFTLDLRAQVSRTSGREASAVVLVEVAP